MMIGNIDIGTTRRLELRQKRKYRELLSVTKLQKLSTLTTASPKECEIDVSAEDENDSDCIDSCSGLSIDQDSNLTSNLRKDDAISNSLKLQMRVCLSNFARECDRHGVSDRCAASLATAVLQDVGVVSESDRSKIVDKCKVRRERKT